MKLDGLPQGLILLLHLKGGHLLSVLLLLLVEVDLLQKFFLLELSC